MERCNYDEKVYCSKKSVQGKEYIYVIVSTGKGRILFVGVSTKGSLEAPDKTQACRNDDHLLPVCVVTLARGLPWGGYLHRYLGGLPGVLPCSSFCVAFVFITHSLSY